MSEHEHLLTRDGELSELTLMRLENGELDPAEAAFVDERLSTSLADRRHVEDLRAFAAENPIAPPAELIEAETPLERGWWKSWRGLGLAAVAAAVGLVVLQPGGPGTSVADGGLMAEPQPDATQSEGPTVRTKGREFDFRLQLEDEGRTRYGEPGSVVHPGERVQFVVFPRRAGYVLVVGIGPDGEVYPAHPREPGPAVEVAASGEQVPLDGALAFDDKLGPERFVAAWCPTAFAYADIASVLGDTGASLPHFRDGCFISAITLEKRERGVPDPDGPDAIDAFDPLGNVMEDDEDRPRPPDAAAEDPDDEPEDPDDESEDPDDEASGVPPQ